MYSDNSTVGVHSIVYSVLWLVSVHEVVMLITEKDGGVYNALRKSTRRSHMENKVRQETT